MVQLQHQLLVTGDQWGSIAALIGGVFFVWADIERDAEFQQLLVRDVEAFVKRVRDRRPPEADDSTMTTELLQRLYPKEKPITIQLPVDLIDPVAKYRQLKADKKHLEDQIRGFENALRNLMGEANVAMLPNGDHFTLRTRKEYTVKQHTVKASRLLRFVEKKGPRRIAGQPAPLELTAGEDDVESED
jgi:predicted phage-related endonuclease